MTDLRTIPEAVQHYSYNGKPRWGPWWFYTNARKGAIPCVRIGGKVFINIETFDKFLQNLERGSVENKKTGELYRS